MKFKSFEDTQAVDGVAKLFASFRVMGTGRSVLQDEGMARFFTSQFILREYDPMNPKGFLTRG